MAAAEFDLTMEQRSTFRLVLRLAGLDLTGYAATMQIRADAGAPGDPLYELSVDNGRIVVDVAEHTLTLTVPDEDTAVFPWHWGLYDLLLEPPNGEAFKLLKGEVHVDRTVTR